nr:hypothetical protein CFP56_46826 [Quercus suber]POE87655.1 hypothetical protein CFP56_30244 [Quercus suber]
MSTMMATPKVNRDSRLQLVPVHIAISKVELAHIELYLNDLLSIFDRARHLDLDMNSARSSNVFRLLLCLPPLQYTFARNFCVLDMSGALPPRSRRRRRCILRCLRYVRNRSVAWKAEPS